DVGEAGEVTVEQLAAQRAVEHLGDLGAVQRESSSARGPTVEVRRARVARGPGGPACPDDPTPGNRILGRPVQGTAQAMRSPVSSGAVNRRTWPRSPSTSRTSSEPGSRPSNPRAVTSSRDSTEPTSRL